uniref:Hist_deacetyl domain-containing protein n=1 Tax=Meloidogyne hapla TaxID=6305 RepID=A0A1I8BD72_MELHA
MSFSNNQLEDQPIPSTSSESKTRFSHLYSVQLKQNQCPIVYTNDYNISFFGIERLHPFDSKKWGRVFQFLVGKSNVLILRIISPFIPNKWESGQLSEESIIQPKEIKKKDLLFVHSPSYLFSLNSTIRLAFILEVCLVIPFPSCLVNRLVLRPLRFQTGGSILAAKLALEYGWAINIGGGFHHASSSKGGGFCVYADITLAIKVLFEDKLIKKAMIIDLDAHQGNGHEIDFIGDNRVYIMDFYNEQIYPKDRPAKKGISKAIPLQIGTSDDYYLLLLERELKEAFSEFSPQLVVYVAGTDSLSGDPLGLLRISSELTSGGYLQRTARVISDSIINLNSLGLIELK